MKKYKMIFLGIISSCILFLSVTNANADSFRFVIKDHGHHHGGWRHYNRWEHRHWRRAHWNRRHPHWRWRWRHPHCRNGYCPRY